jgi:sugar lactone lactonase YvrE
MMAQQISTVAGTGVGGYNGDGGAATEAQLYTPMHCSFDVAGNLYIADGANYRVRQVTPDGTITTVAGSGKPGLTVTSGPAKELALSGPRGVAVDGAGLMYIADGYLLRKVTPGGTISVIAGGSYTGALDVVFDQVSGSAYFAESNRVLKTISATSVSAVAGIGIPGYGGDGGPANVAQVFLPTGVAVDADGNLYVADTVNSRIRKISRDGIISTVAGNGVDGFSGDKGPATEAQLNNPGGVAVDASGVLYIADTQNHRVRKVSPDGVITTVAGTGERKFAGDGGPADKAALREPNGVALDSAGNLYISDSGNHRVRKVSFAAE